MNKLLQFIEQNTKKILWASIFIYIFFFSVICILKYNNLLYNSLDLAIINNTFYNTLHGHPLWSSIQGHSYLGDHFTPIIFLLIPIYAIYQSPITLLILQTIFLGATALPIYKISNYLFKQKTISLLLALLWLTNPLVHNINLFEFHFISLFPLFILFSFYFYLKKQSIYLYISILLSLLIREDIAFIILIFGIILLFNKIKNKKIQIYIPITVILSSIIYFLISTKIINHFSPSNFSPFAYYYSWLKTSNLSTIIKHLVTLGNIEMIIGLFLPFLFIPLIKPKYLLLALTPFTQITMTSAGGSALVWQLHYSALFLPALVIAFIYSFKKLKNKYLLIILLVTTNIYLAFHFGPLPGIKNLSNPKNTLINQIPAQSSVMASYNFLPNLSSRQQIYSLHYFFLGQQQFAITEYQLPENPEYILINFDDLLGYDLHLKNLAWTQNHYPQGHARLQNLLKNYGPIEAIDNIVLFKKNHPYQYPDSPDLPQDCYLKININNKIKYLLPAYTIYHDFPSNFELVNLKGGLEIDKLRSTKIVIDRETQISTLPVE